MRVAKRLGWKLLAVQSVRGRELGNGRNSAELNSPRRTSPSSPGLSFKETGDKYETNPRRLRNKIKCATSWFLISMSGKGKTLS